MRLASTLFLSFLLAACGADKAKTIEGSYAIDGNEKNIVLTFKKNGKAEYLGMMEIDYELEGETIKLKTHDGVILMKPLGDDTYSFILGPVKKVKS